jgi:hypothetical protein
MGLKGLMTAMGMNSFAIVSLVLFVGSFVAICIWTWTRSSQELAGWARLYEDRDDLEPRPEHAVSAVEQGDGRPTHSR